MQGEFGALLRELWQDLHQPDIIWQVAVLAACVGLAWLVDRALARRRKVGGGTTPLHQRGIGRIALPLTALGLVLVARPLLAQWHHVNLLSLAVPLLLSLAVIRMVFFVLRLGVRNVAWLASFEKVFSLVAWSIVALYITGLLPGIIDLLEGVQFTVGKQKLNLWLVLQGVGVLLTTLLVALWIGGTIEARLMAASGLDSNLRVLFSRLSKALLIVLAVMIGLPLVGIDLTTLSVFGGALGVGLGLGLQKIAANYISGFIILLDRSIRIGNLISVGNDRGQVTQITTRFTVLRGMTGVEAIVPNEMLVASVVQNESYSDPKVRVALPVQVAYATDLDRAMAILVEAALAQPRVLRDPPPKALVTLFADSGINLELGFWIEDPEAGTGEVRSAIYLDIWREFKAAGMEIPFPQREIRILGGS
ncbi:mechanosensitive ion channel family protein [Sulfurisoma sediminicola]|uniref:Mechanosensitive ion channel-like protein n=1 Tax=Sulfurisoma sediminicola TaxID=1381557 RepID=A0A497XI50_9PROT|nr:mechanosensitive ion channel domain-containing protein [Sulfurisoma sediminicola]RLJ67494.1 mechanosensitive ion channel-like protein [Sulfurisoma sediminicola]